jgi:hypothetical protein
MNRLSDELACRILVNLEDENLNVFAAASDQHQLLVKTIDTHGREMAVRALGNQGVTLDPGVMRTTQFIGINYLRFKGMLQNPSLSFSFDTRLIVRLRFK